MKKQEFRAGKYYERMQRLLMETLEEGAIKRVLIVVDNIMDRGIGKTTALIRFAKKYNMSVFLCDYFTDKIEKQREIYNYEHIYTRRWIQSYNNKDITTPTDVVIDEGVNPSEVSGFKIVTGFVTDYSEGILFGSKDENKMDKETFDFLKTKSCNLEMENAILREKLEKR